MTIDSPLGILYGVGVGPGDPELISIKGLKYLQNTAVIAFPEGLAGQPGVAQQIIAPWLNAGQQLIPLAFPYVQDENTLEMAWAAAAQTLWPYLAQGQDVVFASEGDVSFFSTFTYLSQALLYLHPDLRVETIPGICSPLAAAAALGMPLTVQSDRLAIIPALYQRSDLETALRWADVVVLMKVSSVYESVWQLLKAKGLLEQSAIVVRATSPKQQIYRGLQQYPNLKLPYFSLLIVHR